MKPSTQSDALFGFFFFQSLCYICFVIGEFIFGLGVFFSFSI